MKTILILGGNGFLGSNIIAFAKRQLPDLYKFVIVDGRPASKLFEGVKEYVGNAGDSQLLEKVFIENKIDIVVHSFSASIPASEVGAKAEVEGNLLPTLTLLDTMLKHSIKDIVFISSGGAIYGNRFAEKHKESDDVFPISSYGVTKLMIEKYLMQYAELFGLKPLILRLSNPYGLYHYSDRQGICNVALKKAVKGEIFTIYGDGKATKDYIFVEDFADILFRLIKKEVNSTVLNVASSTLLSVNDILNSVKNIAPDFRWQYKEASIFDVPCFALDTSKLESVLGIYSFTPFAEGLQKTFVWEKDKA